MVPPNGGPDHILIRGTDALRAVYEVDTPEGARFAVQQIAALRLQQLKIWIGNRGGTYPAMPPEIIAAVVDEAHKHNIKVHAHATGLAEQKLALRTGVDVLVHPIRALDDELLALLREKRPYWTPLLGFGDRSPVCDDDPFFIQTLPQQMITEIRERVGRGLERTQGSCNPLPPERGQELRNAIVRATDAGALVVLGTDAGPFAHYTYGWSAHRELELYVQYGMSPMDAIVAATSRPAELLGIRDAGTLKRFNRADFLVLDANPLEDIRNTRRINNVYLLGTRLDRNALLAEWQRRGGRSR